MVNLATPKWQNGGGRNHLPGSCATPIFPGGGSAIPYGWSKGGRTTSMAYGVGSRGRKEKKKCRDLSPWGLLKPLSSRKGWPKWGLTPIGQNANGGGSSHPFNLILIFFFTFKFKFLKFYFFNELYDSCQVLIGFTWKSVSFLDGRWTDVLFGYMLISEVPHVIESETNVEKNKVVKIQWAKRYFTKKEKKNENTVVQ